MRYGITQKKWLIWNKMWLQIQNIKRWKYDIFSIAINDKRSKRTLTIYIIVSVENLIYILQQCIMHDVLKPNVMLICHQIISRISKWEQKPTRFFSQNHIPFHFFQPNRQKSNWDYLEEMNVCGHKSEMFAARSSTTVNVSNFTWIPFFFGWKIASANDSSPFSTNRI